MAFISTKKTFLKAAASGDLSEIGTGIGYYGVNLRDGEDVTALSHAARNGKLDAMKKLMGAGADLEIADVKGATALLAAQAKQQSAAALMLINAGADVNTHDKDYVYPLHYAACNCDLDVVKALIDKGADLNTIILKNGRTPLHWAVDKEYGPVIEALAMAGARTDIASTDGKTALDLAKDKSPRTLKLLEDTLAKRGKTAAVSEITTDSDVEIMKPLTLKSAVHTAANEDTPKAAEWQLMGDGIVAKVGTFPAMNRRLTEIFNFENKERVIISENLKTGAETMGQPEKFSTLADEIVQRAAEQLKTLGGAGAEPKKTFNL